MLFWRQLRSIIAGKTVESIVGVHIRSVSGLSICATIIPNVSDMLKAMRPRMTFFFRGYMII
jgi:hypothetical protein